MAEKRSIDEAKKAKLDEFYTQRSDIEEELQHYEEHFKGKTVLCNCDDPFESQFFQYFALNFEHLGLKKLIATSYSPSPIAGTQLCYFTEEGGEMSVLYGKEALRVCEDDNVEKPAYKAVVTSVHDATGNGGVAMVDVYELLKSGENQLTKLEGNGDFRSKECLALLDEADIVVTNPPFSLFREYVATLMAHEKKFIIIGNVNAITYKEIFPLLKENKIWLGYGFKNGNAYFSVAPEAAANYAKGVYDSATGLVKFRNCCWYTNLDIKKIHEEFVFIRHYSPEKYPKYDNYDAINVNAVVDIPGDYSGVMGVPITFMDKYNPDQFEIIGSFNASSLKDKAKDGYVLSTDTPILVNGVEQMWNGPVVNKKPLYKRIVIRRKKS